MKYKNRTEQQKIDPYDVPATAVDAVYVDDIDNITEEIELTLEQLQQHLAKIFLVTATTGHQVIFLWLQI